MTHLSNFRCVDNERRINKSSAIRTAAGRICAAARTPFLTGRARASWNGSLDKAVRSTTRKGRKQLEYADPAAAMQLFQNKFMTELREYLQRTGPKPAIYIVNRLPYAVFLERGSSKKAPQGMVKVTLAEVEANFSDVKDVKLVGPIAAQVG